MNFCCSASFFYLIPPGFISDAIMSHLLRSGSSLFVCFYNDRKRISLCESISEKNSITAYNALHDALHFFRRYIEDTCTQYSRISPSIRMNCVICFRSFYRGIDETSFECRIDSKRISFFEKRSSDFYLLYIAWFRMCRE